MTTLGIFTVKKVCLHKGLHYTYGGFGEYLDSMRTCFHRVVLVAHVKEMTPPPGHYLIPAGEDLQVIALPQVRSELGVLLTLPLMFLRSWRVVPQIDIAHCRMPDYTGVVGAIVCRLRKKIFFCQIVDDWHAQAKAVPISRKAGLGILLKAHLYVYDWIERLVCRRQLVFAQGESCYQKHRYSTDCELTLSSAHHLTDVVSAPSTPRFTRKPYTLLTVARLTSVKNQSLTIRALARLRKAGHHWRVVFVGEGPTRPSLVSLARQLGVEEYVTFAGQLDRGRSLWSQFDSADCFVLSSRAEGTPKVLLEAMARGLPIAASNVTGVPSVVEHEKRGLLFPDNDLEGLVAAIRRIANDPELRRIMTMNGRSFATEHTIERQTERMLKRVFSRWPELDEQRLALQQPDGT